jgi:hypothetical protein
MLYVVTCQLATMYFLQVPDLVISEVCNLNWASFLAVGLACTLNTRWNVKIKAQNYSWSAEAFSPYTFRKWRPCHFLYIINHQEEYSCGADQPTFLWNALAWPRQWSDQVGSIHPDTAWSIQATLFLQKQSFLMWSSWLSIHLGTSVSV